MFISLFHQTILGYNRISMVIGISIAVSLVALVILIRVITLVIAHQKQEKDEKKDKSNEDKKL